MYVHPLPVGTFASASWRDLFVAKENGHNALTFPSRAWPMTVYTVWVFCLTLQALDVLCMY